MIFESFQPSKCAKIHKKQSSEPQNVLKWHILHFKNPKICLHCAVSNRLIDENNCFIVITGTELGGEVVHSSMYHHLWTNAPKVRCFDQLFNRANPLILIHI